MARLRRNGGLGQLAPREGAGNLVQPERVEGRGGSKTPMGTRLHAKEGRDQKFEPVRNGMAFEAYDPSAEARARRARDPRYRLARRALALAEQVYGKRPQTIRGLPVDSGAATRRKRTAGSQGGSDPAVLTSGLTSAGRGRKRGSAGGARAA